MSTVKVQDLVALVFHHIRRQQIKTTLPLHYFRLGRRNGVSMQTDGSIVGQSLLGRFQTRDVFEFDDARLRQVVMSALDIRTEADGRQAFRMMCDEFTAVIGVRAAVSDATEEGVMQRSEWGGPGWPYIRVEHRLNDGVREVVARIGTDAEPESEPPTLEAFFIYR